MLLSVFFGLTLTYYVYARFSTQVDNSSNVSVKISKTVVDVPIHLLDSSNSKYVTNLPETTSVYLEGPRNILSQLTAQNLYVTTEDLAKFLNGEQNIPYFITGLPSGVTGVVIPSTSFATISDKVTVLKSVTVHTKDVLVASGYQVGTPKVSPETVNISGSQEVISKIHTVEYNVVTPTIQAQTFNKEQVTPIVKDSSGNILDVKIENAVNISVPIFQSGQKVPIEISLVNQKSDYTYTVNNQSVKELTLLGDTTILNKVSKITATVNVENIVESQEIEAVVLVPVGVTISEQQKVIVTLSVSKVE